MIYNVYTALASLKPTQKWTWDGTDYSGLVWSDSGTAPTESEINAELTRLTNAEPMRLLRIERDKLLAASDWRASSDLIMPEEWKIYRQRLRDLPEGNAPDLNSDGDLDKTSINWPTPPS